MAKRAFISHISEEADVAKGLKKVLTEDFPGMLDIFVSSDSESIAAGEPWLVSVKAALMDCAMLIILCSRKSIERPWINFEAGAAWLHNIPLIPVCHFGLEPWRLPMPLSLQQASSLDDPDGLRSLYAGVARIIGRTMPLVPFPERATEVRQHQVQQRQDEKAILDRLMESLNDPDKKWRSLTSLAGEAAISPEVVHELLRPDMNVQFRISKRTGKHLVGLKSRVGKST